MREQAFYEIPCMEDKLFPASISKSSFGNHVCAFGNHWHEHVEFLYILSGEGIIECNTSRFHAYPSDLVVVNSGELHCGYSASDNFSYHCIIVNPSILQSSFTGICEVKYIQPITQNQILFHNRIQNDKNITVCIEQIIKEFDSREIGFELSIKSQLYQLFSLLVKHYIKAVTTGKEYDRRKRDLERLTPVLAFIEQNYQEKISSETLAKLANLSYYHFSHLFKSVTNRSVTDYLNHLRVNKAAAVLAATAASITEVALDCGFTDMNYFSRQFKKVRNMSPTNFRKQFALRDAGTGSLSHF